MAKITMDMIKELRERTSAGVVDCKKVLAETDGDIEKAVDELQKKGIAKAAKKQGRIAAEGKVGIFAAADSKVAAVAEINCETDFVSKGEKFDALCQAIAQKTAELETNDISTILAAPSQGDSSISIEQSITNFTAATGEKTSLRRIECFKVEQGKVGIYNHDNGRICVLVEVTAGDAQTTEGNDFTEMANDVAMHIAAMNPSYVSSKEIPAEDIERQKSIFTAVVLEEGKPENIAPKIVEGKLAKWKKENCLVDQVFVKDNDLTISALIAKFGSDVEITRFARFEVGEGMQKRVNDLAAEVAEMTN
ncbi:MAG: elongation factor Ts [Deltaproteobacteria bacterium]|nr:elongation factor Ts [Deltaproteobacteria bacterium]